ncbi:MAG: S41 family peptidase [Saprospiraceae bacterium]|nr:S41 family peptidase [Saprospiraceae bacterium]
MPEKHNKVKYRVWEPLLVAISAAIGLLAGYNMNFNNNDYSLINFQNGSSQNVSHQDGRIEEILRFIETNYVDSLNHDVIAVDAIKHILRQLDPHSSYISPDQWEDHNEKMEGEYNGIGIETLMLKDTFFICRLLEEGPAEKAGIRVGDALLQINGDTIAGNNTPFSTIRSYFKNNADKEISIMLKHVDSEENEIIKINPKTIEMSSANNSYLIDEQTAYLEMTRFSSNTYEQFMKSIETLIGDKKRMNLIIDLRDNPGGFLPEAISILSQLFEDKDRLLCYTEGLNRKKAEYFSTGKSFFNIGKIAVLINEYSASGSEILAGAIQDWDRGVVIGKQSYGKGLVQEIFPLKNGGALRLTIAKYYTPSGRLIQKSYQNINKSFHLDSNEYKTLLLEREVAGGGGIIPDVTVDATLSEYCYSMKDYADYYIINEMVKAKSDDIELEVLNTDAFKSFILNTYGDAYEELTNGCDMDFSDFLKARYIRISEGEAAYLDAINAKDAYVNEALKFINNQKTTMALLAEEN